MRVLVNALPLRYGGGVTYLEHQLAALHRVAPDLDLHTLVSPWGEIDGLPGTIETVPARSVLSRFSYEQLRLPWRSADVLYCPANFGPIASRAPMVLTQHNAHYFRSGFALEETRARRPAWKVKASHWAMQRADAVVAISHAQAAEIAATVPSVTPKMTVIHSGTVEWPARSTPVTGLPDRYLLVVSNSAAHKRDGDVVAAWTRARQESSLDVALVVVGRTTQQQVVAYRDLAGQQSRRLMMRGALNSRAQLKWIYEHATALISMSALESFPLTPAEAGSVGCPIVLSDIPAHREATLGNATFVPLADVASLAEVLVKGLGRWVPGTEKWDWPSTWDDNARRLLGVLESVRR